MSNAFPVFLVIADNHLFFYYLQLSQNVFDILKQYSLEHDEEFSDEEWEEHREDCPYYEE